MNKLVIIGNVCHKPELRTTQGGKDVATFTVAVNRKRGDRETDYFRVSAWGKTGVSCAQFLDKGRKVCVIGEVTARAYDGKDGSARASLEVTADEVEFLSPIQRNEGQSRDEQLARVYAEQNAAAQSYRAAEAAGAFEEIADSDLPF